MKIPHNIRLESIGVLWAEILDMIALAAAVAGKALAAKAAVAHVNNISHATTQIIWRVWYFHI